MVVAAHKELCRLQKEETNRAFVNRVRTPAETKTTKLLDKNDPTIAPLSSLLESFLEDSHQLAHGFETNQENRWRTILKNRQKRNDQHMTPKYIKRRADLKAQAKAMAKEKTESDERKRIKRNTSNLRWKPKWSRK